MSQHDFQVDSGNGFGVRADINAAIQALASSNSGLTEPPVKYAGMWWADTTAGMLKQRNTSNTGWIDRFPIDGSVAPCVKFVASGTVNAISGVTNIGLTTYPTGWQFTAWVSGSNTLSAPTISLDGLPVKTVKKQGSAGKVALALGDYNQFGPLQLEYDGTDFILLNPLFSAVAPVFKALKTSAVIPSGVSTKFIGFTVAADTHGYWDSGSSRYNPKVAGWYQVTLAQTFSVTGTLSYGAVQLSKSSSSTDQVTYGPYAGQYLRASLTRLIYMNGTTDYLECYAEINGSGTCTVTVDTFEAVLVRAG